MKYIIVQTGVYRHEIFGVYGHEQAAIDAAKRHANEDYDCYHEWEVLSFDERSHDAAKIVGVLKPIPKGKEFANRGPGSFEWKPSP